MRLNRRSLRSYPLWVVEFRAGTAIYHGWKRYCVQARNAVEAKKLALVELANDGYQEFYAYRISRA